MALTQNDIADLVTTVQNAEVRNKIVNIDPTLLRGYPGARRFFKKNAVSFAGGMRYSWPVNVVGSDVATEIGLFHVDVYGHGDHVKKAAADVKLQKTHYEFDELEEVFSQGKYVIVDHIKNRMMQAKISLMKRIDSKMWSFADTTDELSPQGILYILPYCATEGFVGTVSGSHTTVYDISPTIYTGWKSYGAPYAAITQDDGILKMRTAWRKVHFENPLDSMDIGSPNTSDQFGIYTNLDVILQLENELRLQNDNLGKDIASMDGKTMFRGVNMEEVPALESNTRDPIIGINWGTVKPLVVKSWWMKEKTVQAPHQALVTATNVYCGWTLICYDRRQAGFNIALAA